MKKIVAFISGLLFVVPAIAQENPKDKNKMQGVSKVKPADVNKTPAAKVPAANNVEHKQKGATNLKNSNAPLKSPQQKVVKPQ